MDRGAWRATVHGVAKSWTRRAINTFKHAQFTAGPYLFSSQDLGRISVPPSEHVHHPNPFFPSLRCEYTLRTLFPGTWQDFVLSYIGTFGLKSIRLLCPWNSSGKNTGVRCHFPLQAILPTRDRTPTFCVFRTAGQFLTAEPKGTNFTAAAKHFRPAPPLSTYEVRSAPPLRTSGPAPPTSSLSLFPIRPKRCSPRGLARLPLSLPRRPCSAGTHQRPDLPLEGLLLSSGIAKGALSATGASPTAPSWPPRCPPPATWSAPRRGDLWEL